MRTLIKIVLQLVLVTIVSAGLSWSVFDRGVRVFLADTVGSSGTALLGVPFNVSPPDIDYQEKKIRWANWKIPDSGGSNASPLIVVSSVTMQLSSDFSLDWRNVGLLPSPIRIKSIILDGIIVSYDIDKEGESLNRLKNRISSVSEVAMRDRMNAAAKSESAFQSFVVNDVSLKGIVIDAISKTDSRKSQLISSKPIDLHGLGTAEQGLDAAMMTERVSRNLMDTIRREALSRGLVEVKKAAPKPQTSTRRKDAVESKDPKTDKAENGASEKLKAVGRGFKKAGQSIGQGFKKLFN